MNFTRHTLCPGVILDARRAVFLEEESILAVADLHYGYAWTHRFRGQLMPLSMPEDTGSRLEALLAEYQPRVLAVLGDIVHGPLPTREVRAEFQQMIERLEQHAEVQLIAGNHDRTLSSEIGRPLPREYRVGSHHLLHGDGHTEANGAELLTRTKASRGRLVIGHEHPAIAISDRVTSSAKVPCFLSGESLLVLPAFSPWAAGGDIRSKGCLSCFPNLDRPTKAIAILAGKLLPVRID